MLRYKLIKESKEELLYQYFPEGGTSYGTITFDKESGYWIYKVMFEIENQSNKQTCILESYFRYYNNRLYVIPDTTPTLIGADSLTEKQVTQLTTLFDL